MEKELEIKDLELNPLDVSPEQDGGVLKRIIKEGVGAEHPPNGCRVQVHYVGTLLDGTKFDSSRDRGEPFEFNLGQKSVIKAWEIGVATMKKGEIAVLTCAPDYAYGKTGSPPTIPGDATLKFEVEVLGWKGEDISPKKDGTIERLQIKSGDGYDMPNDGALVEIHLEGRVNGILFEERDVSFNLGEGGDVGVVEGVEKALERFKRNETSKIIVDPKLAYGSLGIPDKNVPGNTPVEYIITLKSFEKAKESWSLDTNERIEQARIFKEKGTAYFKAGKFELAVKMYSKVIAFLKDEEITNDDKRSLELSANLNMSLCYLKLQQFIEAKTAATAALTLDENNEKAYFRRGQALLALEEATPALKDFQQVLTLEPSNKAARAQINLAQKLIKDQLAKERRIYANMFDKFAKVDTQKEEEIRRQQPDVMKTLGEWGEEERERAPTTFEKENPNILMLNGNGEFKDM